MICAVVVQWLLFTSATTPCLIVPNDKLVDICSKDDHLVIDYDPYPNDPVLGSITFADTRVLITKGRNDLCSEQVPTS